MFSETNGKLSFSRIFSALVIVVSLGLVVYLSLKKGELPAQLGSLAAYTTTLVTCTYGLNKITTAIEKK